MILQAPFPDSPPGTGKLFPRCLELEIAKVGTFSSAFGFLGGGGGGGGSMVFSWKMGGGGGGNLQ